MLIACDCWHDSGKCLRTVAAHGRSSQWEARHTADPDAVLDPAIPVLTLRSVEPTLYNYA
jgi:hypothetical protein